MTDLSLHILDLIENSIRAKATLIVITVAEDPDEDTMTIALEDDGPGLNIPPDTAMDPFYTTKDGKRIGLGLSLFRCAVEQAGGRLSLSRSEFGGLAVEATMCLSHVDRSPLGDIAATVSSVVCTNPEIDVWCRLRVGGRESSVRASEEAKAIPVHDRVGLSVARRVDERIKAAIATVEILA